jgi:hypothetical protein
VIGGVYNADEDWEEEEGQHRLPDLDHVVYQADGQPDVGKEREEGLRFGGSRLVRRVGFSKTRMARQMRFGGSRLVRRVGFSKTRMARQMRFGGRVCGLELRALGVGLRGLGFRVEGVGCRVAGWVISFTLDAHLDPHPRPQCECARKLLIRIYTARAALISIPLRIVTYCSASY